MLTHRDIWWPTRAHQQDRHITLPFTERIPDTPHTLQQKNVEEGCGPGSWSGRGPGGIGRQECQGRAGGKAGLEGQLAIGQALWAPRPERAQGMEVDCMGSRSGLWSRLCGLPERSGLWSGLFGSRNGAGSGADSFGSRNGAGSGADSVSSRNGAGSGADSVGSRNGVGSGADSVGSRNGAGSRADSVGSRNGAGSRADYVGSRIGADSVG